MNSTSPHPVRLGAGSTRVAGLTGLRAIAVIAVLGYHLVPGVLPGGFLGVDVFFVVSGFIVTRLLLIERRRTGRIAPGAFWIRRARRILPALGAMLLVCIPLAAAVAPDLLVGLRRQLIGAVAFSTNWIAIASDGDYFQASNPDLFTNLWSLAVEEQFYLVWPVALALLLVAFRKRPRALVGAAVLLAAISALAMGLLSESPSGSPTRAYFGTDTHAFGLLLGVALAVAIGPTEPQVAARARAVRGALVAACSLAVLVVLAGTLSSASPFAVRGGLMLASVAAIGLVWSGATVPAVGRVLDVAPLAWIGERSYAIYLWHWPLLLILKATALGGSPPLLAVATSALSVAAAALSFVVVEAPFRRGRTTPGRRGSPRRRRPGRRVALPVAVAGALVIANVVLVVVHDDRSTAEILVARGAEALRAPPPPPPSATPSPTQTQTPPATGAQGAAPAAPEAVVPQPAPILGTDITAVGDSVMLAAAPELQAALPGIAIDAQVSRSMWPAPGILSSLAGAGGLRPIVVLGLATNGDPGPELLARVLDIVGTDRILVLVNAHADRGWVAGANESLATFAAAYPSVVVAEWDSSIASCQGCLAGDGIHPQPAGGEVYASTVAAAITQARADEAQAAQVAKDQAAKEQAAKEKAGAGRKQAKPPADGEKESVP